MLAQSPELLRSAALDWEAQMQIDSAVVLLRRAVAIDDSYFPALYDYLRLSFERGDEHRIRARFRELAERPNPPRAIVCAVTVAANLSNSWPAITENGLRILRTAARANPADSCAVTFVALNTAADDTGSVGDVLRRSESAIALPSPVAALWCKRIQDLGAARQAAAAEAAARDALARNLHPLERLEIVLCQIKARRDLGDIAGARRLADLVASGVRRDARPGLLYMFTPRPFTGDSAGLSERVKIARRHRSKMREAASLHWLGHHFLDRGDPSAALRAHDREMKLVRSAGSARLEVRALVRRGRVYSKLARWREAERDLRSAIWLGASFDDRYFIAEAYHNLAHTYEGTAKWAASAQAADDFVTEARRAGNTGMVIVGLHDAGTIRWKAGWHASAQRDFVRMVHMIDSTGREPFWAGEYYQKTGELGRAARYYRRSLQQGGDATMALAALVNVYEILGHADSAEAAARLHDSRKREWQPLETPMVPILLTRQGRLDEALEVSRAWLGRQTQTENRQGAAKAGLQVADILLWAGQHSQARREAGLALEIATRMRLPSEAARALGIIGIARVRAGDMGGLRQLLTAAELARRHSPAYDVAAAQLVLGDAYALAQKRSEALAAYGTAAAVIDNISTHLKTDIDMARYRAHQSAAFNGAMQIGLDQPGNLGLLLNWSSRRKAAALRAAVNLRSANADVSRGTVTLSRIQKSLQRDEVLLDYTVLDDRVAVLVISRTRGIHVPLRITPDSLQRLVNRWRRHLVTMYAGRIDVTRSRFDYLAAHALYDAIVRPALAGISNPGKLVISPDGPLHYVAFEGLVMERYGAHFRNASAARYLLDHYDVSYTPSPDFIAGRDRGANHFEARLLLMAGDAPAAEDEVRAISGVWPARRTVTLSGTGATETAMMAARSFGIVHVASHAEANGRDALASHIRLAPDAENDGLVHLTEIARRKGSARLVVLSACETIVGPVYQGEGRIGLARAFMASGASGVVAAQWPVGAVNAELMRLFYQNLARRQPVAEALSNARRTIRGRPATSHPIMWAGIAYLGI